MIILLTSRGELNKPHIPTKAVKVNRALVIVPLSVHASKIHWLVLLGHGAKFNSHGYNGWKMEIVVW